MTKFRIDPSTLDPDGDIMDDMIGGRDYHYKEIVKQRRAVREENFDKNKKMQDKKLNKPKRFDKFEKYNCED